MKRKKFNEVVENQLGLCRKLLIKKNDEYASEDEVLHNFIHASNMSGDSVQKAIWYFRLKHEISLKDIVDDIDENKYPSKELLTEKITDNINYLLLLKASIIENIEKQKK